MARKTATEPKVQRGLSLSKSLYQRIGEEADKYGRTWNETVELVLTRAFPCASDLQIPVVNSRTTQDTDADDFIPEEDE